MFNPRSEIHISIYLEVHEEYYLTFLKMLEFKVLHTAVTETLWQKQQEVQREIEVISPNSG